MAIWELIRDAVTAMGGRATIADLKEYFIKNHPDKNIVNITFDTALISVNVPSRVHYHGGKHIRLTNTNNRYDCLFKSPNGYYEIYDPEKHGVWEIFKNNGKLSVRLYSEPNFSEALTEDLREIEETLTIPATEKVRLVNARLGQGWYRAQLIEKYKSCLMTSIKNESLLRASHIKPWRSSSNFERLDTNNGLLLSVHMDALFDQGFISFESDGSIMISSQLDNSDKKILNLHCDIKIDVSSKVHEYLVHHRSSVFRG